MSLQGVRPRDEYGPRTLLPNSYGYRPERRVFDKKMGDPRGKEALPLEWAVLCPNRIAERRIEAGYENTMALSRSMDTISYQRLKKIECGRVIVRESEYELIADHLEIKVDDLKLPLLTQSETRQWNEKWGPDKKIEEGGDHDSVLLAAYVRKLIEDAGANKGRVVKMMGAPNNCLSFIWYAEKPIDRYPDTTMAVVIRLSGMTDWNDVIMESRRLYESGDLDDQIRKVQTPRTRYAPEDPDRRAPWTYVSDPFRVRTGRHAVQTPFSKEPLQGRKHQRERAERRAAKAQLHLDTRERMLAVVAKVRNATHDMLHEVFPLDPVGIMELRDSDIVDVRSIMARTLIARICRKEFERIIAAEVLGLSRERVRQLQHQDLDMIPRNKGKIRPTCAPVPHIV